MPPSQPILFRPLVLVATFLCHIIPRAHAFVFVPSLTAQKALLQSPDRSSLYHHCLLATRKATTATPAIPIPPSSRASTSSTKRFADAASDQLAVSSRGISGRWFWDSVQSSSLWAQEQQQKLLLRLRQHENRTQRSYIREELVSNADPVSGAVAVTSAPLHKSKMNAVTKWFRRYGWSLPLALCLVPLYTAFLYQASPATPQWWKLTNLEYLWHQHANDLTLAHSLLTVFLSSNVSYFLAGLYLLQKYPFVKKRQAESTTAVNLSHSQPQSSLALLSSRFATTMPILPLLSSSPLLGYVPSRATWLSLWLFLAGTVSTLFHAVQAYGDYAVAEGWCYLDHGIAISATLYFAQYCRLPERPAWILGCLGMLALALPVRPGYLWLHASWHFLSAGAAVLWATQRSTMRRARLEREFAVAPRVPGPSATTAKD